VTRQDEVATATRNVWRNARRPRLGALRAIPTLRSQARSLRAGRGVTRPRIGANAAPSSTSYWVRRRAACP